MAEYIDREKIHFNAFFDAGDYSQAKRCVYNVPTADVIERSKIEKALEQTYKVREIVLHSNRTYEANDVLDIIDEISACFERHIGE